MAFKTLKVFRNNIILKNFKKQFLFCQQLKLFIFKKNFNFKKKFNRTKR